jgi:hypothetical protein
MLGLSSGAVGALGMLGLSSGAVGALGVSSGTVGTLGLSSGAVGTLGLSSGLEAGALVVPLFVGIRLSAITGLLSLNLCTTDLKQSQDCILHWRQLTRLHDSTPFSTDINWWKDMVPGSDFSWTLTYSSIFRMSSSVTMNMDTSVF